MKWLFSRCHASFATSWTVAHQAPLSTGFSRQEYWSGLPFLPPADFPDPGVEPASPILAGRFFITELLGKSIHKTYTRIKLKNILQSCLLYPQGQAQTGNLGKRNHYSLPPSKFRPKGKEGRKVIRMHKCRGEWSQPEEGH